MSVVVVRVTDARGGVKAIRGDSGANFQLYADSVRSLAKHAGRIWIGDACFLRFISQSLVTEVRSGRLLSRAATAVNTNPPPSTVSSEGGGGGAFLAWLPRPGDGSERACSQSSLLSGSVATVAAFISRIGVRGEEEEGRGLTKKKGHDKWMTSEQMHRRVITT